jgi:hypothetical protein
MPRAVSIHIGVNEPQRRGDLRPPLKDSEADAWRMAELAHQAGYDSMLVLRGSMATLATVHAALLSAAQTLEGGDTLLVTYSGHGHQVPDTDFDERTGLDQTWSLYDDELLDDDLNRSWRLFRRGVRIVVVSESCYSGGMDRGDDEELVLVPRRRRRRAFRGEPDWAQVEVDRARATCVVPRSDDDGIKATVLILTASGANEKSQGAVYTECLLNIWDGGRFTDSYCKLHSRVRQAVQNKNPLQEPHILMVGTPDVGFADQPAFRRAEQGPDAQTAAPEDDGPPPAELDGGFDDVDVDVDFDGDLDGDVDGDDDEWYDRGRRRPVNFRG